MSRLPLRPRTLRGLVAILASFVPAIAWAQPAQRPDWPQIESETMRHFQALLRFDTSDPPGNEKPAADYLKRVLEGEGIPVEIIFNEANRPNVVARIKGNGSKRPLLIMAHTDVVNTDSTKWTVVSTGCCTRGVEDLRWRAPAERGSSRRAIAGDQGDL